MMPPDELEQWKRYASTREDATRNAIAERYFSLVHSMAAKMNRHNPRAEVEAMESAGYRGLLDAIRTFDLARGCKPVTHLQNRIRGAMLDDLRGIDPVSRYFRRQVKAARDVVERLGREPSPDELAVELGVERSTALDVLLQMRRHRDPFLEALTTRESPSIRIETAYARAYLLRGLSKTERIVISGYYFDGRTMKQLGAELGKSEGRISQIVGDVLKRLRRHRNYETEREAV
jgi:RNA polymerase sigma factor FliA